MPFPRTGAGATRCGASLKPLPIPVRSWSCSVFTGAASSPDLSAWRASRLPCLPTTASNSAARWMRPRRKRPPVSCRSVMRLHCRYFPSRIPPALWWVPDSEVQGAVRRMSSLFLAGSKLRVPMVAIFLRKAYGLGAMAMTGGSFVAPVYAAAWPTGEVGGMGLEGAVRLGFKKELEAQQDPAAARATVPTTGRANV